MGLIQKVVKKMFPLQKKSKEETIHSYIRKTIEERGGGMSC